MTRVAAPTSGRSGDSPFPPPQGQWTYADYANLPENGYRYEVIDGNLYMTPAPNWIHQDAVSNILAALFPWLKEHGGGKALPSPIDVILPDVAAPVQPDIVIILKPNLSILAPSGRIEGVPDIVIEVLSPATRRLDQHTKLDAYCRAGLPEYWIVDPDARTVTVHVRRGEAWAPVTFRIEDTLRSEALTDFELQVKEIFDR